MASGQWQLHTEKAAPALCAVDGDLAGVRGAGRVAGLGRHAYRVPRGLDRVELGAAAREHVLRRGQRPGAVLQVRATGGLELHRVVEDLHRGLRDRNDQRRGADHLPICPTPCPRLREPHDRPAVPQ